MQKHVEFDETDKRRIASLYRKFRAVQAPKAGFQLRPYRMTADNALERARTIVEAEDYYNLQAVWVDDYERFGLGDFPHNANLLNACKHDHGGVHILSRGDAGLSGGRGHYPGELRPECDYYPQNDVLGCEIWQPCDRHSDEIFNERFSSCRDCKVLESLWDIELERNYTPGRKMYQAEVESDLYAEALAGLHAAEAAAEAVDLQRNEESKQRYLTSGI